MFKGLDFTNVYYFIFGLVGFGMWFLSFFRIGKKSQIIIPSIWRYKSIVSYRFIISLLMLASWIFLTIAIMGPRRPAGMAKNKIAVNDILFVVDVSRSMLANDFAPNRLEAAKKEILDFVSMRPTDRIGIIIFSEKAFTLLPLSTDLELIKRIVAEINVGYLGSGTNIGDALGLAVGRASTSLAKNKVIILLTDGVSNVGNMTPEQAADEAKKQKIKVYTIGIGGHKDAMIPVRKYGRRYQKIPGGSIDFKTLQSIADLTGGNAYVAQDKGALKDVMEQISKLEKTDIEIGGKILYEELYWKYLIIGLILLMVTEFIRKIVIKEMT